MINFESKPLSLEEIEPNSEYYYFQFTPRYPYKKIRISKFSTGVLFTDDKSFMDTKKCSGNYGMSYCGRGWCLNKTADSKLSEYLLIYDSSGILGWIEREEKEDSDSISPSCSKQFHKFIHLKFKSSYDTYIFKTFQGAKNFLVEKYNTLLNNFEHYFKNYEFFNGCNIYKTVKEIDKEKITVGDTYWAYSKYSMYRKSFDPDNLINISLVSTPGEINIKEISNDTEYRRLITYKTSKGGTSYFWHFKGDSHSDLCIFDSKEKCYIDYSSALKAVMENLRISTRQNMSFMIDYTERQKSCDYSVDWRRNTCPL